MYIPYTYTIRTKTKRDNQKAGFNKREGEREKSERNTCYRNTKSYLDEALYFCR